VTNHTIAENDGGRQGSGRLGLRVRGIDQEKLQKNFELLFVKRVILSAGAMLIFSVSFQIDQMPEGEKIVNVQYYVLRISVVCTIVTSRSPIRSLAALSLGFFWTSDPVQYIIEQLATCLASLSSCMHRVLDSQPCDLIAKTMHAGAHSSISHDGRAVCITSVPLMQRLEYVIISIRDGEQHNQIVLIDVLRICAAKIDAKSC